MEKYLRDLIKILGIGAGFASIPMIVAFAGLEPPWPPAIGPVSSALILLSALAAWEWTRSGTVKKRRSWFLVSVLAVLVGLILYLTLYSLFIEPTPGGTERIIRGYTCTEEAKLVFPTQCPDLPREALRDAEWEAAVLWTRGSITVVRMGLAISWLIFIAGLVGATGSIVAGRKVSASKTP